MNTRPCSFQEAKQHLLEKHESRLRVYMRLTITGPYRVRCICPVSQRVLISDNTDSNGYRWISPDLKKARWFVEDLRARRHRFVALMFRRRKSQRHEQKFRSDPRYRFRYGQAYAERNAPSTCGRSFQSGGRSILYPTPGHQLTVEQAIKGVELLVAAMKRMKKEPGK